LHQPRFDGFTLVELLVVITIFVMLLALLMPAMEKAVYQAELAVCASRQDAIGSAAILYAHDHQRRYPDRFETPGATPAWQPTQLISPVGTQDRDGGDLRPVLRGYFDLNGLLNDPLAPGKLDFVTSSLEAYTHTPYALWFGWRFGTRRGMTKLGDRLEWGTWSLSVLSADQDLTNDTGGGYWGAHRDREELG